jgi:hypothetical protein
LFRREVAYTETSGLNKQRFVIERGESGREQRGRQRFPMEQFSILRVERRQGELEPCSD